MSNYNIETFIKYYSTIIYTLEKNGKGVIIMDLKNLNIKKLKGNFDLFTEYILQVHIKALSLSNNNNISTFDVHVYLKNTHFKNFSLKLFKKVNKRLCEYFEEVLGNCYIYDSGKLFKMVYKIVKPFLDPIVVPKINFIKSS